MAYYGYIRVSTETQAEKGFGMDAQRSEIDKYAAANGITIAEYFTDAGVSGAAKDTAEDDEAIGKRLGLLNMLATVNDDDIIIVANTSRLWRSDITKVLIRRELKKRSVRVISVQQPGYNLYETNPTERFMASVFEALDELERAMIAAKLSSARTVKAEKGKKPAGLCPYGYKYTEDKKAVEIDQDEAAAVKLAFTEAQRGQTLAQIAATLTAKGYTPRRSEAWTRGSVQAILRNRFYVGELQHRGETIKGTHPPIISKVQFGKVAAQLERRHK